MDCTDHCSVTFLMIFNRRFGDRTNIYIQFLRPIFDPILFGFVIPNITSEITWVHKKLKPMTHVKQFHLFKIVKMNDQNTFSRLEVITLRRAVAF